MAKLELKSEQQIIAAMARVVLARTGLNDLNPGSILLTLLQAAAQEDFAQYYQLLQVTRNYNLDTTTGSDLDNRAFEYGLTRLTTQAATGRINILREATFTKIATTFYNGFRARLAGDTVLYLNNAEDFPTSGAQQTLIIGRGTPNEEEVTYSPSGSNPDNNVNYYELTLDVPLANDHALNEEVVLKQGVDIFIPVGTVVRVPASGRSSEITFVTTVAVTILAGEEQVTDVNISCNQPGSIGNIGVEAITGEDAFTTAPFTGARAVNLSAFSNGQDQETDTSLRNRIRNHIRGFTQSTQAGISNAIQGLVDAETAKRVVSSNIILPDNVGLPVKVYIDDGTGFEPSFGSKGSEVIVEDAEGGETRLQIELFPLVKAQIETLNIEPFDFSTNALTLTILVGNESETLTFYTNQFAIPEAATSEEMIKAINNSSNLVEARTSQVGTRLVLNAKADANESIQILGGTANTPLGFPTSKVETFYLYKNDVPLSKDGTTAFIDSDVETFDFSGPDQTLLVVVDGKTANIQTVTISESDFASPAAAADATAAQVAAIINDQLAGATATVVGGRVRISSNTELSASSKIKINTSTAATTLGYSTTQVVGSNQDYKLNPELGVIELLEPLVVHDVVTAGTRNTRAFLTSSIAANYTFVGGETLYVEIDGAASQTITFTAGTNLSAASVAAQINSQLVGGLAVVRTIGTNTYVEIRTNTLAAADGSIEILSASTANSILGFITDLLVVNGGPHTAFQVTQAGGPYAFVEGDTLVVVVDNDATGKTFIITMSYASEATSGTSSTVFADAALATNFPIANTLVNYWIVWKTGSNTTTGDILKVENPSGSTFRYYFKNPAPANFDDFAIGDQVSFSGMDLAINDGNFLITGVVAIATAHAAVITKQYSNPSVLTPVSGDRYLVGTATATSIHANTVISRLIDNPDTLTPASGDRYIIAPEANDTTLSSVKGRYVDSADVSVLEVHGYRYLINGTGLNDWAGHNQEIAQYNGVGSPGWIFFSPTDDDVVYSDADSTYYQYDSGLNVWEENKWGGRAGKVAEYNGSIWLFTNPADQEVRTVTSESKNYQYAVSTNTWTLNDWGGKANQIAQWNGSAWVFTAPATNDTVVVTDETETYQYSGSVWSIFNFWLNVTNAAGSVEAATTAGEGLLGQRRQISAYNSGTGSVTVSSALRATPAGGDEYVLLPGTRTNVVGFFNNTKVTSLSTVADIALADQYSQVQISSQADGSDGFIQVTGGKANSLLQFSNSLANGLKAYAYYTGLIKLIHSTIYGDEANATAFPGIGAAGVKFQILPPTVQEVAWTVVVRLQEGFTLSNVENDIKTKIISEVNSLGIGEEVILSLLVEEIRKVAGIKDVIVTTPSDNVVISENELARTKASIIFINVAN